MATEEVLRKTLRNADGKPFAKYKGITNNFQLEDFELLVDEVQNDRAGHSRMRVRVPMRAAGFPEDTYSNRSREVALRDLIARRFWESARTHARSPIPKTDGGEMYIPRPGQEILERGSVAVTQHFVEVSFTADLPSSGGKVNAQATEELIYSRIARVVSESMFFRAYKASKLYNHIQTSENADHIRSVLPGMGLAAFVATGSILPRRDDDLAPAVDAVPFDCDDSLKVSIEVPNGEPIEGMGLPSGFTVVTGRSRCGKSVLADAVFAGAYNHIPGDGREYVVSLPGAAYVMSEDGRPSDSVDVSAAIGGETSLQSASVPAPVSEAVSVSEAVETGSGLIILDEEYSSPCYIRCAYLAEDDGFVPLSKVAGAMGAAGISVLMVSGDRSAAEAADNVLVMDRFRISRADVQRISGGCPYNRPATRYPVSKNIVYEKGRKEVSVTAQGIRTVEIGEYKVNVPVAGFFDMAQTRAAADAVALARDLMDGSRSMAEVCRQAVDAVMAYDPENGGSMHRARPRPMDVAAILNRHPQMLCIQKR